MSGITDNDAWKKLERLAKTIRNDSIADYFRQDPDRAGKLTLEVGELYLDFSKNLIDEEVLPALLDLARISGLEAHRDALFRGEPINTTEDRPVLHTALRDPDGDFTVKDGSVRRVVNEQLDRLETISGEIRSGTWKGCTNRPMTDVVNIGIGGSDLGPKMVVQALEEYASRSPKLHFLSNVDGAGMDALLSELCPETTLFIVCSKTFTTQETLLNAEVAAEWLKTGTENTDPWRSPHFIAVTADPGAALERGIHPDRILTFENWVGGRYSLWSAAGLSIAISIGHDHFRALLAGAHAMDSHFRAARPERNMPVILGLLGIWYNNFLQCETMAIVPYCERLSLLPSWLQQLDMESNGKSVTIDGSRVDYSTGPVVWGQTGTNGQHAFFQLLHQGTRLVPLDFIATVRENLGTARQHRVLLSNMIAQSAALMSGRTADDPHRNYPGNKPSNTLLLQQLDPHSLGMLLALYEHKIFVQGTIWSVNSFDQWGVELGKELATMLLEEKGSGKIDPSTESLLKRIYGEDR